MYIFKHTMLLLRQLKLILWKHLLIRKRHFILTTCEALLPLLLFALIAYMRSKVGNLQKVEFPNATIHNPVEIDEYFDVGGTIVYYTPQNTFNDDLISRIQEHSQIPTSNIKAFNGEEDLLQDYLASQKSFSDQKAIGIMFRGNQSEKLNYVLRFDGIRDWMTGNTQTTAAKFYETESMYMGTTFTAFQKLIGFAYIDKKRGEPVTKSVNLMLEMFPFPPHKLDSGISDLLLEYLPVITLFSFICLCPALLKRVVEEKQTGIKELLKMVGMQPWMIWLGWVIHGILPMLFSVTCIVILMKVPIFGDEKLYPPIEYTNGVVLFIFLILYCLASITFCFAISTAFSIPSFAMVTGILAWFLTYFIPKYLVKSKVHCFYKLLLGLFPNVALSYGYQAMESYEKREIGLQWDNLHIAGSGNVRDFTMLGVFGLFIFEMIFYMCLTYYVDSINPGPYGIARSIFFPFSALKKAICKICRGGRSHIDAENECLSTVERGKNLDIGINVKNLHKKFDNKVAVNGLSLEIYKDQITVLLGHNGAGKTTTMSMITGMIPASSGIIKINGKNIMSNLDDFRKNLGLCPQHNLFFTDLTVIEHLIFFAGLKGRTFKEARPEAKEILVKLNLFEKRNELADKLSGGMKRKLCLGMAIIGGPNVLILDEPTSGMDPESRRELWDLLLSWRQSKTILITTHFMEEADALGDWIAIMANGKLQCYGTPMFLKAKYETGYHLSLITKSTESDVIENISERIKNTIPSATLSSVDGQNVVYVLPTAEKVNFQELFSSLENAKDSLQIEHMSISITTLEDVFLKAKGEKTNLDQIEPDRESIVTAMLDTESTRSYNVYNKGVQQIKALFMKRWYYTKRKFLYYLIPALVAIGMFILSFCLSLSKDTPIQSSAPLDISLKTYDGPTVYYGGSSEDPDINRLKDFYKLSVIKQDGRAVEADVINKIIADGTENLEFYEKSLVTAAQFSKTDGVIDAIALYSHTALHSLPISLNLMLNSLVKFFLGDSYSINMVNLPFPNDFELYQEVGDSVSVVEVALFFLIIIPTGFLIFSGSFIMFPHIEHSSQFSRIQFMCGVPPWLYWFLNILFDLLLCLPVLGIVAFIAYFWNIFGCVEIGVFLSILIVYLVVGFPFTYLFSRKKSAPSGFAALIITGLFSGIIPAVLVLVMLNSGDEYWIGWGRLLKYVFLILTPHFGLTLNCVEFSRKAVGKYNWNMASDEEHQQMCIRKATPCCLGTDTQACRKEMSYDEIVCNMYAMIGCFVFYMALNIFLDSVWFKKIVSMYESLISRRYKFNQDKYDGLESPMNDEGLVVKNLGKSYGNKRVVNQLSFQAPKGKCTGILGVNGAGKTTTFRMLTREVMQNNGQIFADKLDCDKNSEDKYLNKLGYCPQEDSLNFNLTGREILTTMAMLRDVKNVAEQVNSFIKLFDLEDYADRVCGTYSGGNKRKLSLAVALIGLPPYVLLDEPTNGVDPASRRNFWSIIKTIKDKKHISFILTSHSMAECEALCDEVNIMKQGTIKKNGTLPKLKENIGGFTLMVKLSISEDETDLTGNKSTTVKLKDAVSAAFDNCEVKDEHTGLIHFHIKDNKRLSQLFRTVEMIKTEFPDLIEDYTISEATLEDVFMAVARC